MKKNNNIPMIIMLIFASAMMFKILYTSTNPKQKVVVEHKEYDNFPKTFDEAEAYMDSLFDVKPITEGFVISNNFDFVYNRFKVFNPDLDSSTVVVFNNVCSFYKLDSTDEMLEWCVGQILLESGAKQYYGSGHPKEGKLVESYVGAIGFSQIMPLTAHTYITKKISNEDANCMVGLGCIPFDYILDSTYTKSESVGMIREWLTNETNNIILWGYIMRAKLDKRPSMLKALVSYNTGITGMINYVGGGGLLANHKYVKEIKYKLEYAEVNI